MMPTHKRSNANNKNKKNNNNSNKMQSRKGKNRSNQNNTQNNRNKSNSNKTNGESINGSSSCILITICTVIVIAICYLYWGYNVKQSPSTSTVNTKWSANINPNPSAEVNTKLDYRSVQKFDATVIDSWSHGSSDFTQGLQYLPFNILNKYPSVLESLTQNSIYQTQTNNNFKIGNMETPEGYKHGALIESTGLYKKSKIHYLVPYSFDDSIGTTSENAKNRVLQYTKIADELFGEGVTFYFTTTGNSENSENGESARMDKSGLMNNDIDFDSVRFFVLTWKKRKILEYNSNLELISDNIEVPKEMREGWGFYYDYINNEFISTDGTNNLYFMQYDSTNKEFNVKKQIAVTMAADASKNRNNRNNRNRRRMPIESDAAFRSLSRLNEIELINGWVFANVWYKEFIAIISPLNGRVYATIDCQNIFPKNAKGRHESVLNGIAYNPELKHLIVTGKFWSTLLAIEIPQFVLDVTPNDLL